MKGRNSYYRRDAMYEMRLRAYAKVNLGLDVLRRREDGYHEVKMVMQTAPMLTTSRLPGRESQHLC